MSATSSGLIKDKAGSSEVNIENASGSKSQEIITTYKEVKQPLDFNIMEIKYIKNHPTEKYTYVYKNKKFKELHLHGIIIEIITVEPIFRFKLCDYTGSIDVFFHIKKSLDRISSLRFKWLCTDMDTFFRQKEVDEGQKDALITMKNLIQEQSADNHFKVGDYVHVIGDIFQDKNYNERCVSSVRCSISSMEEDYLWLEKMCYQ